MELIIIAILFIVLYPVLKIAYQIWRQVHTIKKQFSTQFDGQFGGSNRSYTSSRQQDSYQSSEYRRHHRHRFSSTDGQYVEFEEILEERETVPYNPDEPYEPQISDVKYEEFTERIN